MPSSSAKPTPQSWFFLILSALIWGSSFILMKKGLVAFSPPQVATLRIFFSMVALLPFLWSGIKHIHKKDLPYVMLVAIAGSGLPPFLFTAAQAHLPSAAAGILNAFTPLFTLLVGVVVYKVVFEWRKLMGVLLGLAGATVLVVTTAPGNSQGNANYFYGLYILLATLCYGISVNTLKQYCQHIPATALNSVVFALLGPFALLYLLSSGATGIVQTHPHAWASLGYLVILAVVNTAFAGIIYFKLTQQTNALFASTTTYLIPFIAILFGAADGEVIGWSYAAGLALILGGVYLAGR
ncbi:MAG TPA: DMT family transporter [Chitinophagales bacterium]|nr:DMT family transporter [Chitinophagales bacterium]HRK28253.1 DMT family transporter [Chitinophagales bacterium]